MPPPGEYTGATEPPSGEYRGMSRSGYESVVFSTSRAVEVEGGSRFDLSARVPALYSLELYWMPGGPANQGLAVRSHSRRGSK